MKLLPFTRAPTWSTTRCTTPSTSTWICAKKVPFPTTRNFHHAHFARLALDLLVRCSAKFQQYGLCLLQNFDKRHSNRTRLAAAGFIVALCAHIEHGFHVQTADVVAAKAPESRLLPDYLFLLSIVGTPPRRAICRLFWRRTNAPTR